MRLPGAFNRPWLAVVLALIAVGASVVLRDASARTPLDGVIQTILITLATSLPLLAAGILIPVFAASVRFTAVVGLTRLRLQDVGVGICAGLVVRAFTEIVSPTTGSATDPLGGGIAPGVLLSLMVAVAVSPFVEELLFRGVLQRALADGMHASGAAVATAVSIAMTTGVFVLAHVVTSQVQTGLLVSTIAVGLVCGSLTAMTSRLAAAITAHTVHNVIGVALLLW